MHIIRLKKSKLSMDLAPLIDVVFQLLVFFMLTSTFSQPAIQLNLPAAKTIDVKVQEKIIISVQKNGDLFLNGDRISLEDFQERLAIILRNNSVKSVHLKGDQDMSYKIFVQVMDLARQAGAKQVNIIHQSE
ncbi:MAG: biopolymer transporter ExbD [Candidatus Omnitrophica bacterium]|nr:biopolymer transporter ExbD [Candidatus Omnitrophota bacterium]MCB9747887.1 biopolymer transporter ExbD [Candidatus Omnitrophota bacterium]